MTSVEEKNKRSGSFLLPKALSVDVHSRIDEAYFISEYSKYTCKYICKWHTK